MMHCIFFFFLLMPNPFVDQCIDSPKISTPSGQLHDRNLQLLQPSSTVFYYLCKNIVAVDSKEMLRFFSMKIWAQSKKQSDVRIVTSLHAFCIAPGDFQICIRPSLIHPYLASFHHQTAKIEMRRIGNVVIDTQARSRCWLFARLNIAYELISQPQP